MPNSRSQFIATAESRGHDFYLGHGQPLPFTTPDAIDAFWRGYWEEKADLNALVNELY